MTELLPAPCLARPYFDSMQQYHENRERRAILVNIPYVIIMNLEALEQTATEQGDRTE